MSEKVIVLSNAESADDIVGRIINVGVRIRMRFGPFIIVQQPESHQEQQLAQHGIEVQNIAPAFGDLSQLSDEDRLIAEAYLLRKRPEYLSQLAEEEESEEEEQMSQIDCGQDH